MQNSHIAASLLWHNRIQGDLIIIESRKLFCDTLRQKSPFPNGNTDRLVKSVLEKSGKETVFINLSKLHFDPCRGCCHLCPTTNICGRKDELLPYLNIILESEALVLGTPYQLGMPAGFMYNFLTRLFCFHHVKKLLVNKPAILISVGIKPKEIQNGIANFEKIATHNDQFNFTWPYIFQFTDSAMPQMRSRQLLLCWCTMEICT